MTRNIDELSNLTTRAVEPEKYFGEMDLNEEQVDRRLKYTKKANELFDVILILLMTMRDNGTLDYVYARDMLESWLLSLIAEFTTPDDYLIDYATDTAYNFIDTTKNHIDEPWYTSSDRSLFNAENSANDVMNYSEYIDALHSGKTHKKWITEKDNRVRKTHKGLDGKTIGITEVFHVGFALMRFPKDYDLAESFPEELVNCRCSIEYLPKTQNDSSEKEYSFGVEKYAKNDTIKSSEAARFSGYDNNSILADEKVLNSEEYKNKFRGIGKTQEVDDKIYEYAKQVITENSGTLNESLAVLDLDTGNLIAYSKGNVAQKTVYTEELLKALEQAKEEKIRMLALHNHPRSSPTTADDCVSALERGYERGLSCGTNGTLFEYEPSKTYFDKSDCAIIHDIISESAINANSRAEIENIWKDTLSDFGMRIWEKK